MKSKETRYMSIMAMFLAIRIILVVTPLDYLPIGPVSATTMHIPVIITGIALDRKTGVQLGFVFGLTSVLSATFHPTLASLCFSPFVTAGGSWISPLIASAPGILLGYLAGLICEKLCRREISENVGIVTGVLTKTITNTVLVLGGICLFFGGAYTDAIRVAYDTLIAVLSGVVVINRIAEAILGTVATLLVYKAIRPATRKFN